MASIENRVVQMQFDNTSFERRMEETLRSLDKLNTSLANAGSKNGLANLEGSVRGFNLSPIATSIEGISGKFLAMSTIAVTALSTIVSKALSAGAQILSALSLDPVTAGFQEYQTQIGSIQTILANTSTKGTTLDMVNTALQQLNEYSDKTIYNFGEMAKNIGTFTAAGVDLDTSVSSIKGIANLAAISGSNSAQASTAMYQLSQAIAAGSVKLMDWNSIVNAGMGGEVFQKALFETGKQMQTITDVPMNQTFEEWTDAGNSFRGSLETGWLTADVLTKTLTAFTGELTKEQLVAQGFTEQQAIEFEKLGLLGVDAATKVRTLKALLDTTKEALGSGWSNSFKIIFGDFNEATELFTGISNNLSAFISKSADARNALLQGWKDLGGRTMLIEALGNAFRNIGEILAPIKEAFRTIFPPVTAETLLKLTERFKAFADALKPSEQTVENLRRIFTGFFGALEIGWTIIKNTAKFIAELLGSLTGAGSGKFLEFAAKIGDFFTSLNSKLVTEGGIATFFDGLRTKIQPAIDKINEIKDAVAEFLGDFASKAAPVVGFLKDLVSNVGEFFGIVGGGAMDVASEGANRLSQRFETLKTIVDKLGDVWEPLKTAFEKVVGVLDQVWENLKTWFGELKDKLKAVIGPGDFDAVVDAVNVGLLGGIAAILAKFLKSGFKFDLGDGLFSSITKSFEELTGVLSAMQMQIKADALVKIATAVGILTASVFVLSMIDSAALTRALTAMAVGFGQLMGAFAIMNKVILGPRDAAKLSILATGMIAMASAMLIFGAAVAVFSTMSWDELARGMAAVAALLLGLTLVAGPLGAASGGLIRAGTGMIAIAIALNLLAGAVKLFSTFEWDEMLKGFVGVGVGIALIAVGMKMMPNNLILTSAGLFITAAALSALAGAVALFIQFDWGELGKGAAAVGGGLLIIAGAMNLMPANLPITATGLLLVSLSLGRIADALGQFGGMDWGEIGRGLAAMGGALIVLAAGAYAMSGSLLGAVAIGVMAVSLTLLTRVIKELAAIKVGDLIKAMIGLAAVFAILGGAALLLAPITPALLGLGAALTLVGAGFALFGAGAALVAIAFEKIAAVGSEGLGVVGEAIDLLISKLPALIQAFAEGLVQLAQVILDAAPVLIDSLGVVIEHLLSTLIELLPKIGEFLGALIQEIIELLRAKIPEYIQLGIDLILALLSGIRDNIGQVVEIAVQIIANFIQGITNKIPELVGAAANLITTFITAIAGRLPEIVAAGVTLLVSLLDGITNNLSRVTEAVGRLVAEFIQSIANLYGDIITAGVDALIQFLSGITDNLVKVTNAVGEMITTFTKAVGNTAGEVLRVGFETLVKFLQGMSNNIHLVVLTVTQLIIGFMNAVGHNLGAIAWAGANVMVTFIAAISNMVLYLVHAAFQIMIAFINGLASAIETYAPQLRSAAIRLGVAIVDGATFGLASKAKGLADKAVSVAKGALDAATGFLGIGGPSKVFCEVGKDIGDGLAGGIEASATAPKKALLVTMGELTDTVTNALDKMTMELTGMGDFNPVITPVLDLSSVQQDARAISGLMPEAALSPQLSFDQAQVIATSPSPNQPATDATTAAGELKFEQNIYAPTQLSAGEIYRQTRTQLTMAKEELDIP